MSKEEVAERVLALPDLEAKVNRAAQKPGTVRTAAATTLFAALFQRRVLRPDCDVHCHRMRVDTGERGWDNGVHSGRGFPSA